MCQICDSLLMDLEHLSYQIRLLVCGVVYLVLGIDLNLFDKAFLRKSFDLSPSDLFDRQETYKSVFADFMTRNFEVELQELLPYLQFASGHFDTALICVLPKIVEDSIEVYIYLTRK